MKNLQNKYYILIQINDLNGKLSGSTSGNSVKDKNDDSKQVHDLKEQIKVLQHTIIQKQRDIDSISSERSILEDRNRQLTDDVYRLTKQFKDPESLEYDVGLDKKRFKPISSLCKLPPEISRVFYI